MLPATAKSNCPLAVLWLWLAGRADWVLASKSDTPMFWWPWHLGTRTDREPELVYHFKRTRIVKRQPFAPFYFEGRMQTAKASSLKRAKGFMWERRWWDIRCVPFLLAIVAVGLPVWMLASAAYWPCWLAAGAWQAWRCNRA